MASQKPRALQPCLQATMMLGLMLGMTAGPELMSQQPRRQQQQSARTDCYGDLLPEGVVARLGTVRLRAVGAKARLSPDGKTIVTVLWGKLVKSWDAVTGKFLQQRELPVRFSNQAYFSLDGRLSAVREEDFDTPIDIWDVPAGKRLHQLRPPNGQGIYRAAFSPDGKSLAVAESGPIQRVIRLWNTESGEQRELKGHARNPDNLAFSRDGKIFAAADGQRVICWDVAKGEKLWQAGSAFNSSLAFTSDGRTLIASPGHREHTWHAWDVGTGKPADGLKLPEGYNYAYSTVAPDGRTLVFAQGRYVSGADGRIRLWDLRTGKLLHTLNATGEIGPFFPDGKSFLTNDGVLQRWELATGRPLLPDVDEMGHRSEISRAIYSPDGRRLASAAHDGTVRLWDVATAKPLHILRGHEATALAFTTDGKRLVSGGNDGDLQVWDAESGKEVRCIPLCEPERGEKKQHVSQLHAAPDGATILVLGYDPTSRVFPMNGILSRWELATGQRKVRVESSGPSEGIFGRFSPDGGTVASPGELLDTSTGKARVKLGGGGRRPFDYCDFSPDGRQLAGLVARTELEGTRISTKMEGIQIWDAKTGRGLRRIPSDWVGQFAFSPDGRCLAAADLQGLWLWELASGQVVLRHKAHERMRGSYGHSFASCLSFCPDGRSLATGHRDATILVWNLVPSSRPATVTDLPRLWDDLIGSAAARAYVASWRLSDAPKEAIAFLRERLRLASPLPVEQARLLLADLDSDDFRKREAAALRLRELGDRAAGLVREALKVRPSLETRRRLEDLLKHLEGPPSGGVLRELRAVVVLERIGTAEARQILKALAQGIPEARVTREAEASLERLMARRRAGQR